MSAEPVDDPHANRYRADGAGPFGITDATEVVECDRSWKAMVALMKSDAAAVKARWGQPLIYRFWPSVFAVWSFRLGHTCFLRGHHIASIVIMRLNQLLTGSELHPQAVIGPGYLLVHTNGTAVGSGVIAGSGFTLFTTNKIGADTRRGFAGSPRFGDDVALGAHALVFGPVVVGDHARIGAGALVLHDVPAGARVKGPAAQTEA